jgi:hypothetical protein
MYFNTKKLGFLIIILTGLALFLLARKTNNRLIGDIPNPHAYASNYSCRQGKRGIDSVTLTLPSTEKLPGSTYAIYIHSNSFGDTLRRFEEACRAGREHGNYSASYVSNRIFGKDTIKLVEFDADNRILSSTTFKANVIYLNQK